jgi:polysaccharide export outer membrane protein
MQMSSGCVVAAAFLLMGGNVGGMTVVATEARQAAAQSPAPTPPQRPATSPAPTPPQRPATSPQPAQAPPGFVIGPEDVLTVFFWRSKELSGDVTVRPDGKVSLPLLNDIDAAGLTPEQLRQKLVEGAARFLEDPTATVVVKTINSRKVFITGQVGKPGAYSLIGPMTVMQLIALAGGLSEYADDKNIVITRTKDGRPISFAFNYKEVSRRKRLQQNIELLVGDVVIVP